MIDIFNAFYGIINKELEHIKKIDYNNIAICIFSSIQDVREKGYNKCQESQGYIFLVLN